MTRRGWALFLAMCLIWGLPYLLIRIAVHTVSPATLVFVRVAIGTLLLFPVALVRGQVRPVLRPWRPLVAYTAVEIALPWFLLSDAERHITSSLSGLLVAAVPLVGTAIALASGFQERFGRLQVVGLLTGLVGVGAVLGFDLGSMTVKAGLEMAVVVLCYATGPQILARHLSRLPGLGVVACSLALGAVAYLPLAVLQQPSTLPGPKVIFALVTLGVVCTAAAFILFFHLIAEVGAVRATVITYVNPAVAVALGVAILHEAFSLGTAMGFLLILAGSALATRAIRSPRRGSGSPPAEPVPLVAEP